MMNAGLSENVKTKSPYHGIWVVILFELGLPGICSAIFASFLLTFQPQYSVTLNLMQSLALGGGVGILFCFIPVFTGAVTKAFMVIFKRVKDFFYFLPVSLGSAWQIYLCDWQEEGGVFWVYFVLFGVNVAWMTVHLVKTLAMFVELGIM